MGFPNISRYPVISLDLETYGLDWHIDDPFFGVAISTPDGCDYYFDTRIDSNVKNWLREELLKCELVVNHNMKFDLHMLWSANIDLNPARTDCTMIRAALIDEHLREYNLDFVAKKYLKAKKVDDIYEKLARMFGGKPTRSVQMKNLYRAPKSLVEPYAKMDSRLALDLWMWQEKEIRKQELERICALEKRLFPHIFRMERHGIRVNVDLAEKKIGELTIEIDRTQRELNEVAGFPVNPNPSGSIQKLFNPKWVGGVWVAVDGTILPGTPAGKPSIGADQLRSMKHPAAALILKCRKFLKTRDTFISGHILGHVHNGRVHPNINQTKGDAGDGTGTGRLSYSRPALQQIPSRDKDIAEIVRPIFQPDEGQGWSYGDLSSHEFRVFAHYVNAEVLTKAYADNPDLDIHQQVADLTGLPRSAQVSGGANAKQLNLGMIFNMGGGALAEKMGLPFTIEKTVIAGREVEFKKPGEESQAVIDKYFQAVPGVKDMAKNAATVAKSRGYVKTLMGRHIRFPGKQFTHKASGLIYQGTSADLNKDCIIRICDYLASECPDGHLLLNIHDEFNLSIPNGDVCKHLNNLRDLIEYRPELRIPIRVDFGTPKENWWEATKAKEVDYSTDGRAFDPRRWCGR